MYRRSHVYDILDMDTLIRARRPGDGSGSASIIVQTRASVPNCLETSTAVTTITRIATNI